MVNSAVPLSALSKALPPAWQGLRLERLPDKGLAHDHVRLVGTGWLARIPKQSQMQLGAHDNLSYQAACFERAFAGGHTPRLERVLPPSQCLPRGALLVEEIVGRAAVLPGDLPAITVALASLHCLALPPQEQRFPLWNSADPLSSLYEEIRTQAQYAEAANLELTTALALRSGLAALQAACQGADRPPRHLIAFDGHPGNFVIRPDGTAVLVDLEKCRYSYAGLDLAHATLYTSTTWDVASHAVLSLAQVRDVYRNWEAIVSAATAQPARAWHLPLRHAMWLWSITWCAKWRALSGNLAQVGNHGEDWSAQHSDAALVAHVRERVDHYLGSAVVGQVLGEFEQLNLALKPT